MKNLILPFVLLLLSSYAVGQNVPNNDFDNWIDMGLYEEPENWNTPNPFLISFGEQNVYKSTDSFSGNYSAKLETKNMFGAADIPGLITLAEIDVDLLAQTYSIKGGLPLNENVSKLTGMYKYSGVDTDSGLVIIYNFRRDGEGEIDTIGYGLLSLPNASIWTPFTVTMVNQNYNVPDTFNVIILSSGDQMTAGSVLHVDSLAIETNTGIIDLNQSRLKVSVYPNPASEVVNFKTYNISSDRKIYIIDASGKVVFEHEFNNYDVNINIQNLTDGFYTYGVTERGKLLATGSFLKK